MQLDDYGFPAGGLETGPGVILEAPPDSIFVDDTVYAEAPAADTILSDHISTEGDGGFVAAPSATSIAPGEVSVSDGPLDFSRLNELFRVGGAIIGEVAKAAGSISGLVNQAQKPGTGTGLQHGKPGVASVIAVPAWVPLVGGKRVRASYVVVGAAVAIGAVVIWRRR